MMRNDVPDATESIQINGVHFTHKDIYEVVDDFYGRIQLDPVLQVPFKSVEDWPEHIQKLTHFWWIRFGGPSYMDIQYSPVMKHYQAGFDRDLLARWLSIFHDTLKKHLNTEQVNIWKMISERIGGVLSMRDDLLKKELEQKL